MTAVIYARYSSDNQREESIEGQIRECTDYAEKNGITVIKHYIDTTVFAKLPAFKVIFQSILHVSRPPSTRMGGDAAAWRGETVENFPLEVLSSANPVLSSADEPVQRGADEHNQRLCSLQVLLIKTLNRNNSCVYASYQIFV